MDEIIKTKRSKN